jgi:hypothetical protein
MKPELPPEIVSILPDEIVINIYAFVPHFPNKKSKTPSPQICSYSPQMERDLRKLQSKMYSPKMQGKNANYLYELEEFVLD